jgi:hypothetical protein
MVILPILSISEEHFYLHSALPMMSLVGKWFVFWGAGIRLFFAGLRQLFQPRFTAEQILGIRSEDSLLFVRELGAANLGTGIVGMASLAKPSFVLPAAVAAAVFFGIAGIRHATDRCRTRNQNIGMISDLFVSLVLVTYIGFVALA